MFQASVSVVIPAYNARESIDQTLKSIRAQRSPVLETIVVDDGSTDGTGNYVKQHYPWVNVMEVTNGGPSQARNIGVNAAHGHFVALLDADDVWHPQKTEVQLRIADQTNAGLVASDWIRHENFPSIPQTLPLSVISYRDMLVLNRFQTSTVMIKRSLYQELGGFDSSVDGAEDWDLWLRAAAVSRVVKIDWPLVQYRDVETGYSKDLWRLYSTMQPAIGKHRSAGVVSTRAFRMIEAWHHLRFWIAFHLAHDPKHASIALKRALSPELVAYSVPATARYLLPFLWRRWRMRRR